MAKDEKPAIGSKKIETRETVLEFVEGMMRYVRSDGRHSDINKFKEQIEMFAVLPESESLEVRDTYSIIDIKYNEDVSAKLECPTSAK